MPHTLPAPWSDRLAGAAAQRRAWNRERGLQPPAGLDFCSNDYLGLRRDPRLARAAAEAAEAFGAGSGAARLLRGDTPLHHTLEQTLAQWKGAESALLFNTGFQCNATVIPALAGKGDAVFSDALNHASLVDGCRMARAGGAAVEVYRHLDLEDLEARLRRIGRQAAGGLALVATDAVFSMDGDAADLPALVEVCARHDALLLVDEAHATGLLGETGAGLAEDQGLKGRIPLLMGTLGKALGSFGAYIACPAPLREHLLNTCRGFIFSTALPPPVLGASLEAIRVGREETWRRERALGHAAALRRALSLPPGPSAIVPLILGEDRRALAWAQALQAQGFDVRAVRPPTVPEGSARLRITTGAHLEEAQVQDLISALGGLS
ncbi:MAG: 8-amino-7-oxononanoate synthase [Acidobacteria bacterium]|nr:8-amino-7-oxononanoate synthase [Acidobacteriota bacterium]